MMVYLLMRWGMGMVWYYRIVSSRISSRPFVLVPRTCRTDRPPYYLFHTQERTGAKAKKHRYQKAEN